MPRGPTIFAQLDRVTFTALHGRQCCAANGRLA